MLTELLLVAVLAQVGSQAQNLAGEAREDFEHGRYNEARQKLGEALKESPRNPALWSLLGLADAQLNDLDSAAADFRRVVDLAPGDAQSWFNLGALYGRKGEASHAVDAYRHGLKFDPENAAANRNYVFLLMSLDRFREAIPVLEKLKARSPDDLAVHIALIGCFANAQMPDELTREVAVALKLPDFTLDQHLKIAGMLVKKKQPAAARAILDHAVAMADDSAEAHFRLGLLELDDGGLEPAVRQLGRAAQIDPASALYSMRLAEALILWQHYSTAVEFLRAVESRFGSLPDYQYNFGLAYYGAHRFPQAIEHLETAARDLPESDRVQFFLGNCYSSTGDLRQAELHLRKAIELEPRKAGYYAALAQVLRKSDGDRNSEAITSLEKALALNPADIESKQVLALCYEKAREYRRAQTLLEQVVAGRPELVPAHVALARIYYKMHKKPEGDRESAIVAELQVKEQAKQSALRDSSQK